ncbi:MAG: ABC transporter ATP-binding protein [Acidimicrobiales bacterium]
MRSARRRHAQPGDAGRLRSFALLVATGWRADPVRTLGTVGLQIVGEVASLAGVYATKVVVDAATSASTGRAVAAAAGMAVAISVGFLASSAATTTSLGLRERTAMAFESRLLALLSGLPGIEHHERPELLDRTEQLRHDRWALGAVVSAMLTNLGTLLQLGGTALLLAQLSPWLIALPVAGIAPVVASTRVDRILRQTEDAGAERYRLTLGLRRLATDAAAAAELRLHGLGPTLLERHRGAHDELIAERQAAAWRTGAWSVAGDLVLAAAQLGAVTLVVVQAASGRASAGDVVLAIALAGRLRGQLAAVVGGLNRLLGTLRAVGRLAWLIDQAEAAARTTRSVDAVGPPDRLVDGIRLDGVSFTYPGTTTEALRDVDLHLPAGSTVAVVGENGAGKSTLVKLLCRFYEPTAGRITVEGTDLRRVPVDTWRARVSGAFQDHARFELQARETVGVGDLPKVDDDEMVHAAIERAGAGAVLESLPGGLTTQLGTRFDEGVELSGGQWQQLALSRSMMRTEPLLLVLDEPTAALDAATEHALFERYGAAARASANRNGAVTVLVSHRFSTVRMADRIIVVAGGRVVETGAHDELMAAGGLYAELYGLQARGYA